MRQKRTGFLMILAVLLMMATLAFAGQQKVWALQYEYDAQRGIWMWSDMRRGDGSNFSVGSQVGVQIIGMPGTHVWEIYRDGVLVASGTVVVPGNYFNINFGYQLTQENDAGHHFQVIVNGLKDGFQVKPVSLQKISTYPNPFNPTTTIFFSLSTVAHVRLAVYDARGREVALLYNGIQNTGQHSIAWNAGNMPSGKYFCRFQSENMMYVLPLTLLK